MEIICKCNNCGNTKYNILFKEDKAQVNQIVKCNHCGLMFVFPLAINPEERYWEGSAKKPKYYSAFPEMNEQKEKVSVRDYITAIDNVEKFVPLKGCALEVGASNGNFLHRLEERKWLVQGIEPSLHRAKKAKETFGYDFIIDKLEDTSFPENSFDAIFMFHVIEHCLDPAAIISILYKYLKPNGVLVLETPTYDSISFKIFRHRERSIRCDSHYFFFTKKILRGMMEKQGFVVVRHDLVGRTLTLERLLWNISVVFNRKKLDTFFARMSSLLHFNKISMYINIGDIQRIYCKK